MSTRRGSIKEELGKVVRAYFIQLKDGCGHPGCDNPRCVSGGQMEPLDKNQAASKAVALAKGHRNSVCGFALNMFRSAPISGGPADSQPSDSEHDEESDSDIDTDESGESIHASSTSRLRPVLLFVSHGRVWLQEKTMPVLSCGRGWISEAIPLLSRGRGWISERTVPLCHRCVKLVPPHVVDVVDQKKLVIMCSVVTVVILSIILYFVF